MSNANRAAASKVAIIWASLVVFIMATAPNNLPVYLLVVPYVLLYLALSQTWKLIGRFITGLSGQDLKQLRLVRGGNALSVFTVLLLIMQSLGQLTGRDVLTLSLVFGLGYFYILRMRRQQTRG